MANNDIKPGVVTGSVVKFADFQRSSAPDQVTFVYKRTYGTTDVQRECILEIVDGSYEDWQALVTILQWAEAVYTAGSLEGITTPSLAGAYVDLETASIPANKWWHIIT